MTETRQMSSVVTIDGKPFFLARDERSGVPLWDSRQTQTQEGDPTVARRRRYNDWSRGLGDSRGAFRGAVHHSENAFLGLLGRILPGHKIGTIATGHDADILCFTKVTLPAERLLVGGGSQISEVNCETHVVASTQTFAAGSVLSMQLFNDQVAIALGDTTQFYRRSAAGGYSASTVTTDASGDYRYARCFGISGEGDLVRGRVNSWSKCSAADFYATNGNWTAEYALGDANGNINQVFGHNRWDYVLKDEGLYSFTEDQSKESNVLTDLITFKSAENRAYCQWYDHVLLCTYAGLYRYIQQGAARTVGVEEQELSEGPLVNSYPTAAKAFGKWAYVAWYVEADDHTYLAMHRRSRDGDAHFGSPLTAVSIIDDFDGKCRAMEFSAQSGVPELYYGAGGDVHYFQLSRDGRPAKYRQSGTTTVQFSPTDLDAPMTMKYARGLEFVGANVSATNTIQWKAGFDGAAAANVGSAVASLTNTFGQVYWTRATNDSGRVIQLEVDLLNVDSETAPIEIRDVVLNYEERPLMVPGALFVLRLRDHDEEAGVATRQTAKEQRESLAGYLDGAPVEITDPYGDTWVGAFGPYTGAAGFTFEGSQGQERVQLVVRRLDYS